MQESGVAWVLESVKVVRTRREASKVVVVGGLDCTAPAPRSSLLQQAILLFSAQLGRSLVVDDVEGADYSASRGRLSRRSDDGLTEGRCERDEQIMVQLVSDCLRGRAIQTTRTQIRLTLGP
jgi:hypothetical protein